MRFDPRQADTVYAIRTSRTGQSIWIRAGVAFVHPDDSMSIELDVLPLDGKLHVRERTTDTEKKRETA